MDKRTFFYIVCIFILAGCRIVQTVPEGGAITSSSGLHDCPEQKTCIVNIEGGTEFSEIFTAVPNPGNVFAGWDVLKGQVRLCGGALGACSIQNLSSEIASLNLDAQLVPRFLDDKYASISKGVRAIHIGGNWGTNKYFIDSPPAEWFDFLRKINANWIGISVALHYENSLDSSVERNYNSAIPTFADEQLASFIQVLKREGFHVYLTLAFEAIEAQEDPDLPIFRFQLGQPNNVQYLKGIKPENFPWAIDHPDHDRFIEEFWRTYTDQAVHFARLAQSSGVDMYSLGTETELLFRSRSGPGWPNDFGTELKAMTSAVRDVYDGLLTYDMGYHALTESNYYGVGSNHLWEDLGLDIIGISAYFPLNETEPSGPAQVPELLIAWREIFKKYVLPLHERNPDKPIIFLEFGFTDSIGSPYSPAVDEFVEKTFIDKDNNGLDDGEETQSNILKAFYSVRREYPGLVYGAFLWNNFISDDAGWDGSFGQLRGLSIRHNLAEKIVGDFYINWSH